MRFGIRAVARSGGLAMTTAGPEKLVFPDYITCRPAPFDFCHLAAFGGIVSWQVQREII